MDDIYAGFDLPEPNQTASKTRNATESEESDASTPKGTAQENKGAIELNQEIDQVVKSLGGVGTSLSSLWGSVRKQGTNAYNLSRKELEKTTEAARKDLAPYMEKARTELNKLSEQARNSAAAGQAVAVGAGPNTASDNPDVAMASSSSSSSLTLTEQPSSPKAAAAGPSASEAPNVSFYGEVLPPASTSASTSSPKSPSLESASAFFSNLRTNIQANPNIANLSKNISSLPGQLQHISLQDSKQYAEQYLHKGEEYFSKAGAYLNSAVKIVPPDANAAQAGSAEGSAAGKTRSARLREAAASVAGRKEGLIHELQTNSAIMLVDPAVVRPIAKSDATEAEGGDTAAAHGDAREAYAKFLQTIEDQGGFESEKWKARISAELSSKSAEGAEPPIKATLDQLVPSKLSAEAFWSRYFFRVQQIEEDEARRKQVLESAAALDEDDFSWDMEDDEEKESQEKESSKVTDTPKASVVSSTSTVEEKAATPVPTAPAATPVPESKVEAKSEPAVEEPTSPVMVKSGITSPRNSSEEGTVSSYAMVSGPPSTTSDEDARKKVAKKAEEEDSDSDWE